MTMTNSPGSPSTTNSNSIFQPPTPNLGGLQQTGPKTWEPFTGLNGGKPNDDGTETTFGPPTLDNPLQLRPLGAAGQKSQALRQTYSGAKITKTTKISKLKQDLIEVFVERGLDAVLWARDTSDQWHNFMTETDTFDNDSAEAAYLRTKAKFDTYGIANDRDATMYLLNGLDDDLRQEVELFHRPTDGFIVVWYAVLDLLCDCNIDRKRNLEAQIAALQVTQFPQQDMSKFVASAMDLCRELDNMDAYSHDNTAKLLDAAAFGGGGSDPMNPHTLSYRNHIIGLRDKLDKELSGLHSKSYADQTRILTREGLHYRQVLHQIMQLYKKALHNNKWPPASNPIDSKVPQLNLAAPAPSQIDTLLEKFEALLLQQNNKNQDGGKNKDKNKTPTVNPRRVKPGSTDASIEEAADSAGTKYKHYTKVFNGVENHWCEKCSRWTTTHWSATHVPKKGTAATNEIKTAATAAPPEQTQALNLTRVGFYKAATDKSADAPSAPPPSPVNADTQALWDALGLGTSRCEFYMAAVDAPLRLDVPVVETVVEDETRTLDDSPWPTDLPFMFPLDDSHGIAISAPSNKVTEPSTTLDVSALGPLASSDVPSQPAPTPMSLRSHTSKPLGTFLGLIRLLIGMAGLLSVGFTGHRLLSTCDSLASSLTKFGSTLLPPLVSSTTAVSSTLISSANAVGSSMFHAGIRAVLPVATPLVSVSIDVLEALPPFSAFHAVYTQLPSLLEAHMFTRAAIAVWLWLFTWFFLIFHGLSARPPIPLYPRHIRRHLDRLSRRRHRRPRSPHPAPFRHWAHQPSRSSLLRTPHEGEGARPPHTGTPVGPFQLNFHAPRSSFHRCCHPSNRSRRRLSGSALDRRLRLLQRRAALCRRHWKATRATRKRREAAVKQIKEWEMRNAKHHAKHSDSPILLDSGSTTSHIPANAASFGSQSATDDSSDVDTDTTASVSTTSTSSADCCSCTDHPPIFPTEIRICMIQEIASSVATYVMDSLFFSSTTTPDMEPTFDVIWDSGASVCVSHCKDDFIGKIHPPPITTTNGINGPVDVLGCGFVSWTFRTTNHRFRTLVLPALYIPAATGRLLSTGSLINHLKSTTAEEVIQGADGMRLTGNTSAQRDAHPILAPYSTRNGLPTALAYRPTPSIEREQSPTTTDDATVHTSNCAANTICTAGLSARDAPMMIALSEVSRHNTNLCEADKEWLKWHQRLGHRAFSVVQYLFGTGTLAKSQRGRNLHTQISKRTEPPKCAACCYSKAKRRPVARPRSHKRVQDHPSSLRADTIHPGQEISVDHMVSSVPGRLYSGYGKGNPNSMFKGTAFFVDNATGYVAVQHQTSLNTHETLRAKEAFESQCRDLGVLPQKYRSDNAAVFTCNEYKRHLEEFSQTQRFAGVGQHHANGIVEKAIQDIQSTARTLLIHLAIRWPEQADLALWPMAIDHAVFIHNHLPNTTTGRLSPMDTFSRQRWPHSKFHDIHVFGCPTYVLDKKIADGKSLPKFLPRAERHVHLGFSPFHASTVPLVLNPRTGAITAQFNCVFDDWFATIATNLSDVPTFMEEQWQRLFGDSVFQFPDLDSDPPSIQDTQPTLDPSPAVPSPLDAFEPTQSRYAPPPLPSFPSPSPLPSIERERTTAVEREQPVTVPPTPPPLLQREQQSQQTHPTTGEETLSATGTTTLPHEIPMDLPKVKIEPSTNATLRRSSRSTKGISAPILNPDPSLRTYSSKETASTINLNEINESTDPYFNDPENKHSFPKDSPFLSDDDIVLTPSHPSYKRFKVQPESDDKKVCGYYDLDISYLGYSIENAPKLLFLNSGAPVDAIELLKAATSDPDILSWDEAMAIPEEREKWLEAALAEIRALEQKRTWLEAPESDATVRVIPGTWVFKRKRAPDGKITKFKARWVLRGDLQSLDMDTRADVVSWSSVRIFMVLSLKLGWCMKSIDFTNACLHATLPDHLPMFAHLPRGFHSTMKSITGQRTILRMKKSCYGTTVAPRLWFEHVMKAFLELGFRPSAYDKCFLIREDMMVVVYVDDCGISTDDPTKVDVLIEELRKRGFDLELEGDFESFLGVEIRKLDDNRFHLLQEGLITKVLETAEMSDCNDNHTPAAPKPLGKAQLDEDWPQHPWKYSSIVGMLIYLCTNTRPDICYSVSCAARFNAKPKQCHATAVKTILRYLHKTKDKGLIIDFNGTLDLEAYCDADFAGLHNCKDDSDPTSARSRGGYIIYLGGVPLIWKSSLLPCITLSTLEAEYMQLSRTITVLLGIKNMLEELLPRLKIQGLDSFIKSTVFEDNAGALILATNQNITSRTRYLNCRWHHFWSWIHQPDDGPPQDNPNGTWTDGKIKAGKVASSENPSDIMTKGLVRALYERCRLRTNGW